MHPVPVAQTGFVRTTDHAWPRYGYSAASAKGPLIAPAAVINHQDAELAYLGELVDRKVLCTVPSGY